MAQKSVQRGDGDTTFPLSSLVAPKVEYHRQFGQLSQDYR